MDSRRSFINLVEISTVRIAWRQLKLNWTNCLRRDLVSMGNHNEYFELTEYLRGEGHSDAEIESILARVRQYEVEIKHDSIMDAIGNGTLDLAALIKEALGEQD